jgi:hypothetical protein
MDYVIIGTSMAIIASSIYYAYKYIDMTKPHVEIINVEIIDDKESNYEKEYLKTQLNQIHSDLQIITNQFNSLASSEPRIQNILESSQIKDILSNMIASMADLEEIHDISLEWPLDYKSTKQ